MIPWIHLDTTPVPGGGELRLMRRDAEYCIMSGSIPLMNSRYSGSEEALARLGCARVAGRPAPHILIGGLGMGFTLRAALPELGPDARITVAELVPGVVAWARGHLAPVFGTCLDDPRVQIHAGDVGALIRQSQAVFDAILLDVDNGPEGLTRESNDALYGFGGLGAAHRALKPGGIYAVWSAHRAAPFTRRLQESGFAVEEVKARANGVRGGARHLIWMATKTGAPGRRR